MRINYTIKNQIAVILIASFLSFFTTTVTGQFFTNGTTTQLDEDCYRLTPTTPGSIASIWREDQIDLTNSFDFNFSMNFGCTDIGADGMVFVLQNISSTILGQSGGDIGYGGNFSPSLGVEFDTYDNIINADLSADHIAIQRNGNVEHNLPNNLAGPIMASPTDINIEDCAYHPVQITWNADDMTMEVYFDCVLRLSYTGDIVNDIFGGDPMVYWGFTGSTGGKTNVQSICFNGTESTSSGTNQTLNICEGDQIQLNASQQNATYTWTPMTGLSDPNISNPTVTPTENISYIGMGIDQCDNEFIDTFNIVVNTVDINFELLPAFSDTTICTGEEINLMVVTDANNNIEWQDGSTGTEFTISQAGSYEVMISNDCAATATVGMEVGNSNCMVSMANVFTPNGDGVNDFFAPISESSVEILQFKIYNRWGEKVYDDNTSTGWDGTSNKKSAPSDVYIYTIEFKNGNGTSEIMSGDVTLIR